MTNPSDLAAYFLCGIAFVALIAMLLAVLVGCVVFIVYAVRYIKDGC
jgi:hypothetical protein